MNFHSGNEIPALFRMPKPERIRAPIFVVTFASESCHRSSTNEDDFAAKKIGWEWVGSQDLVIAHVRKRVGRAVIINPTGRGIAASNSCDRRLDELSRCPT